MTKESKSLRELLELVHDFCSTRANLTFGEVQLHKNLLSHAVVRVEEELKETSRSLSEDRLA